MNLTKVKYPQNPQTLKTVTSEWATKYHWYTYLQRGKNTPDQKTSSGLAQAHVVQWTSSLEDMYFQGNAVDVLIRKQKYVLTDKQKWHLISSSIRNIQGMGRTRSVKMVKDKNISFPIT